VALQRVVQPSSLIVFYDKVQKSLVRTIQQELLVRGQVTIDASLLLSGPTSMMTKQDFALPRGYEGRREELLRLKDLVYRASYAQPVNVIFAKAELFTGLIISKRIIPRVIVQGAVANRVAFCTIGFDIFAEGPGFTALRSVSTSDDILSEVVSGLIFGVGDYPFWSGMEMVSTQELPSAVAISVMVDALRGNGKLRNPFILDKRLSAFKGLGVRPLAVSDSGFKAWALWSLFGTWGYQLYDKVETERLLTGWAFKILQPLTKHERAKLKTLEKHGRFMFNIEDLRTDGVLPFRSWLAVNYFFFKKPSMSARVLRLHWKQTYDPLGLVVGAGNGMVKSYGIATKIRPFSYSEENVLPLYTLIGASAGTTTYHMMNGVYLLDNKAKKAFDGPWSISGISREYTRLAAQLQGISERASGLEYYRNLLSGDESLSGHTLGFFVTACVMPVHVPTFIDGMFNKTYTWDRAETDVTHHTLDEYYATLDLVVEYLYGLGLVAPPYLLEAVQAVFVELANDDEEKEELVAASSSE
jgi:hypothetical protein